jgi:molecular chaperone HtpG
MPQNTESQNPAIVFGANIIGILTVGMYHDSKVIYREYIQNACDQIDKAITDGLLKHNEGRIEIWLDQEKRIISIEDNATGIPAAEFRETLGNVGDSRKIVGENKGFRGIGHLCGLAYCKEQIFTSKAKGEHTISILHCDAANMRFLIAQNNSGNRISANALLDATYRFETKETSDIDAHYFKVEMIGISDENTDLLDAKSIREYLSFVAPVPYSNVFLYRSGVKSHAKELSYNIDEYDIKLDGTQIFKNYVTTLKKDTVVYDEIFDVSFKDFFDDSGNLIAWMWFGLTKFKQAIPKINLMRGLRLRKQNIQIGGEDALQKLFKEDRGNSYFVGEVFAVDKDLIPDSQRDYFEENSMRVLFENKLRRFFNEELHKVYYNGSAVNSAFKKISTYETKAADFTDKEQKGMFVSEEHRDSELEKVNEARKEAETAQIRIEKAKEKAEGIMAQVIERIEKEQPIKKPVAVPVVSKEPRKPVRRTDKLSTYNRSERKLISKIFDIIIASTDNKTSEMIISKIEDGLS